LILHLGHGRDHSEEGDQWAGGDIYYNGMSRGPVDGPRLGHDLELLVVSNAIYDIDGS